MKKGLLIPLVFCLVCSCNKYDIPKCDFDDASQDLLWLKDIIEEREANPTEDTRYCYISQAKLKRRTVFILGDCNPAIDKVTFIIDCEGESIKNSYDENLTVGEVDLEDERMIWKPNDFGCDENGNTIN